ncbi:hypothetical protein IscW_ISCW019090 [Ixodes scapularis]|uniref:Uncharacterized protein n=1 Tax=Ixodes scapularis TaxID=6945 RepID=B7PQ12_IXOSC|nr:hypothetical protein IscW_ISCW019090 [Ixodes scapularis]|eukprot:XP_002435854.1 hypothetical protein IscW_ISCW019090 [Ixodes scapularis]
MSFETFNSKVSWSCFNDTGAVRGAGVPTTLPHSIESFLDLVRQVEGSHWAVDAADTAALLLRRFSIDFVDHQRLPDGERFVVNSGRERKSAIFEALLKTSEPPEFNEAALSEDRKCALFAMLSHALNSGAEKKESALLRTVQEQGVVNIAGNTTLAVTMGHVLRGIVASKYSVRDSAENLLKLLKPYSDMPQGHSVIDHIYGPTLAGHLGTLSSWSNTKVPIIGASGFWKTSMCPREFRVARKPGKLTDAEILGALDGFILGTVLKRISKDRPRRLSQLLDMYYSRRGIRELLPEFPKGLSYCTRKEAVGRLLSPARLEEQVLVMARLFAKLDNAEMKHTAVKMAILPMLKSFHVKLDRLLTTCDTRSDILILLDPIPGNTIYDNYQKKLAGYMAERFLKKSDHSAISISASELSEDASNLVLTYSNRGSRYVSPSCAIDTMVDKAVLGVAAVQSSFQRHVGNTVGHEGSWSGTFCPARYKVKSRQEWSTYSLLRGAIDGFLLAKYTRKTAMQNVSLSELMRLYYGSSGVPQSISGIPNLSVCSRRELLYPHLRDGHLEGNVSQFAQAYSLLRYGQSSARLGLFVAMTAEEFLQRLRRDLLSKRTWHTETCTY